MMRKETKVTSQNIFEKLRNAPTDVDLCTKVLDDFRTLEAKDKLTFLEPTIEFLDSEEQDLVRSWGTSILEIIGGEVAFRSLAGLFKEADTEYIKQKYVRTRFFGLKAAMKIVETDADRETLNNLYNKIWEDEDEEALVRAAAAILLAQQGRRDTRAWIINTLRDYRRYWPVWGTLRALRELHLPGITDEVIRVMRESEYVEHQRDAIRVLRAYGGDKVVTRALGDVTVNARNEYIRLEAVTTLAELRDRESQEDLVRALQDENAEIRFRASRALVSVLSSPEEAFREGSEEAASTVIQRALRPGITQLTLNRFIEALRQIDPDRNISTEILSKELVSEDRKRAEAAEKILIDLGGWAAVHRLSQRRRTLDRLDGLLAKSEEVVKSMFERTMAQARFNFYFAMVINGLIVVVGIILVGLAIFHLSQEPEKLERWLVPGGAGVLGVIINLFFNNPRKNARNDLATLMNVNVIFLGFLRQLNEIDATFKHLYIEGRDFGITQMTKTVQEIEDAVGQALDMVGAHLRGVQKPNRIVKGKTGSVDQNEQGNLHETGNRNG